MHIFSVDSLRNNKKIFLLVALALLLVLPFVIFMATQSQSYRTQAAGTQLAFTVFLHGIGKGGDIANANSGGNTSPRNVQKTVSVGIFNAQNVLVMSKFVPVTYNSVQGNYTGSADFGSLASGAYNISVRADKYLQSNAPGIQNITSGQNNNIAPLSLIAGDVVVDNVINIQDYNLLMNCYADLSPAKACTSSQSVLADLTDDGSVNQLDYNLFIREIGNRSGAGGTVIPTRVATTIPTSVPAATIKPVTPTPPSTAVKPVGGPNANWKLVFADEFNGTSLDPVYWAPNWFGEGGKMNDVATYKANVAVTGGNLILTLASSGNGALVSTNPTGGASKGFQFATGYAEAKIFFPGAGATVYNWPAWWTDGQNWPANGEIDIAEGLDTMTTNYHSNSGANNSGTIAGTWAGGYHTYAVDRQTGKIDIYWDGKLIRSVKTDDNNAPHYLILNVGAGSKAVYGAGSQMKVDYVRVWQR